MKPKLGVDFFERGFFEKNNKKVIKKLDSSLIEILRAFAKINSKKIFSPLKFIRESIFKIDDAVNIVMNFIFKSKNWILIQDIIPKDWKNNKIKIRSAMATTFSASLELAKSGDCLLEQNSAFTDLKIKGNDFRVKK